MRLLEITNDFPPTLGGIENYIYSLVARWDPGEVVVLTRDRPGAARVDATLGARVHRMPVGTLLPSRRVWARVSGLLAEGQFDMVHFASPLPLALLGPRITHATGIPYAVSVHGGEFVAGARLARPLMQRALGGAAVALPVSQFTRDAILALLPDPPPTEVISPGVDACAFSPERPPAFGADPGSGPGGPVVLTVCRLVARKGPATLIAALPRVREAHPGTTLAIVGGGPDRRRLERVAAARGLQDSVRFLGPQPWDTLGGYYAAADVFALPTRERFWRLETEGFPLVFLEAAAAGLPSVAGAAGGVREAVVDGETGVIVDGRDAGATATALIRLLDDPAAARAMGAAARERARVLFSWERVVERFRTALEKALSGHARPGWP
ncbi:MAG TPA: glycosyltransferase family 4 protein [Actinomycetota bacterium]|nr:glycosyltransferase family 4 protein [Actinomycetota bacterium]